MKRSRLDENIGVVSFELAAAALCEAQRTKGTTFTFADQPVGQRGMLLMLSSSVPPR
jgi:hypothetical protein